MDRRDISRAIFGVAAASMLVARNADAATCPSGPAFPQTPAESQAGVAPACTAYPPGNLLRYGADPTGVSSSDTALTNAIAVATVSGAAPPGPAVVYAPAGTYLFTTGVSTGNSSFTLTGDGRGATVFKLNSSNPNAAILTFTAFVEFITIEKIQFVLTGTLGQYCLNFPQGVGDTIIDNCCLFGNCTASTNTGCIGIAMTASTQTGVRPYDGDIDIRDCWIADHYVGIAFSGATTTVRVTNCEFGGAPTPGNSYGIDMSADCSGIVIQSCTLTQWGIGIYSEGGYLRQMSNYFEANTQADWFWVKGASVLANSSIAEINPGRSNYCSYPSGGNCTVIGPTYVQHS